MNWKKPKKSTIGLSIMESQEIATKFEIGEDYHHSNEEVDLFIRILSRTRCFITFSVVYNGTRIDSAKRKVGHDFNCDETVTWEFKKCEYSFSSFNKM